MRLFLLTSLVMVAFAANSVLTRFAVNGGYIDPTGFAIVRVAAGAAMLWAVFALRGGRITLFRRDRAAGACALAIYIIGFSLAYLTLDAGLGALILFGVVQITMFGFAALRSTRPTGRQILGAGIAFAGLVLVLWPGAALQVDLAGSALMVAAGLGWAAYTIIGKGSSDPLGNSAANFVLCVPLVAVLAVFADLQPSATGILLGVICGAITSGLGYALWYAVLPKLLQSTAAVVQLSVPVIAILAGAALLQEPLSVKVMLATALVLGGIAIAVSVRAPQADRS